MRGNRRPWLWLAVRLLVAGGLVAYVLSRTEFHDAVRLAPDAAPLPVLRETAEGVFVADGPGERFIPHADLGPGGGLRIAGIGSIARRLAENWGWAAAAIGVMLLLQSPVGAVRWQLLLEVQGIRITFAESLRLTFIGWFFNNWMPGSTGGDFVKAYYIARRTHRKAEAVTTVFLDRLIGLVAMCMLGAAAVAATWNDERVRVAQIMVGAFLAAVAVGGGVFYSRRLRRLLLVDRLLAALPLGDTLAKVDRALFVYRYHKGKVALAVVYSWLTQAAAVLAMGWLAMGLGSQAAWYHYFLSMPAIWIGWSLVPVPGGFGVAETLAQRLFTAEVLGGAAALSASGAATLALAMMLAYRLVQWIVSLPGGVLYLARRTAVSPTHMRQDLEADEADA